MKRCPKCGCETFYVAAHVTQDWIVNCYGDFGGCINDCVEITHKPDDDDIWECANCGYDDAGKEFNVEPMQYTDFCDDEEKMVDFKILTKDEFLASYSYLTEEEYDLTAEKVKDENQMFGVEISYSWGDCEDGLYGKFKTEEEAFEEACKLAGKEAYVYNEEFDEYRTATIYVDAFNKQIDLHYDADHTWCYYKIKEINNTKEEDK